MVLQQKKMTLLVPIIVTISLFLVSHLIAGIWWAAGTAGRVEKIEQRCDIQERYVAERFYEVTKALDKIDSKLDRALTLRERQERSN